MLRHKLPFFLKKTLILKPDSLLYLLILSTSDMFSQSKSEQHFQKERILRKKELKELIYFGDQNLLFLAILHKKLENVIFIFSNINFSFFQYFFQL